MWLNDIRYNPMMPNRDVISHHRNQFPPIFNFINTKCFASLNTSEKTHKYNKHGKRDASITFPANKQMFELIKQLIDSIRTGAA